MHIFSSLREKKKKQKVEKENKISCLMKLRIFNIHFLKIFYLKVIFRLQKELTLFLIKHGIFLTQHKYILGHSIYSH